MNKLILSGFLSIAAIAGGTLIHTGNAHAADAQAAWVKQVKAVINDMFAAGEEFDQPGPSHWPQFVKDFFKQAEKAGQGDVTTVFTVNVKNRIAYLIIIDGEQVSLFDGLGHLIGQGTQDPTSEIHWND
jgi:hypothetical protein